MDFRTPTQMILGLLLAATALSVLGLTANNIAFANDHKHSPMQIHYIRWNESEQKQFSYWVQMDYLPSRFSLSRMSAMLASCLICTAVGAGVAAGSWMMRGKKALNTSFSLKPHFLSASLVLTSIAFLLSLAVAVYAWHPVMRWPISFQNSLPLPPQSSDTGKSVIYQSPFDFTPEIWNCYLWPYVVDPTQSKQVHNLCREANVAKYLMIPVLLLSAVLLMSLGWAWRQASVAAASETETTVKEIEEVSVHSKE